MSSSMTDGAIGELAGECGIAVDWIDATDQPRRVSVDTLRQILKALGLPCATPAQCREACQRLRELRASQPLLTTTAGMPTPLGQPRGRTAELALEDGTVRPLGLADGAVPPIRDVGYHRLRVGDRELGLAVAPPRCLTIADVTGGKKAWGVAVQLYGLRRQGDGGIGDTGALQSLVKAAAREGADAVALSPTHSLFPHDPERYSPYAPSSRLFLNPLLADAGEALPTPDAPLIDWPASSRTKYALLRRQFDAFAGNAEFDRFVRESGDDLAHHARFEAERSGAPIAFHFFLQWIADRAFAGAHAEARRAGMLIGLISDLAVGVDPTGSQVASRPDAFLRGVTIGAPPDAFAPRGQDWGLTSFSPWGLVEHGFAPFLATLRAAMRHAGGVRIDHAMGLMRLWLVPEGAAPTEGAYLTYPLDDLMRLLALESHRNRAVVIGEDLGTVPPDFQTRCRDAGIAGMDVLWFTSPKRWRREAVAMTSTHDLPTVAGWWRNADAASRTALWSTFTEARVAAGAPPQGPEPVVDAACAFVAGAPDGFALLPLEDLLGLTEQPNVPGTTDEHPNWRRRLAAPAEELLKTSAVQTRLKLVRERRK